jgi:SOS-response transcriptional repressor LexA
MVSTQDQIQQSVRRWVRTVMHEQGWSAEEWARRAATTPTNITRILSTDKSLPNADTLARLARVAGSQPDLVGTGDKGSPGRGSVPLLDRDQVMTLISKTGRERTAFLEGLRRELVNMQVLFRPSATGFAVRIETDSLRGRGLLKDDVVVVQPSDFSGEDHGTIATAVVRRRIGAWLWYPPLLVPAHESDDPVPIKDAVILGRVLQLTRQL